MDEVSQREIQHLRALVNRGVLRPPAQSNVTMELLKLLERLSPGSPVPSTEGKSQKSIPTFHVSVSFSDPESKSLSDEEKVSMSVSVSTLRYSLEQTVREIEKQQTYRPNARVLRMRNLRTNVEYREFDLRSLLSVGFQDGDRLLVYCGQQTTSTENKSPADKLQSLIDSAKPSDTLETIAAAAHHIFLSMGFVYMVEQPSTVAGFAPSLKGIQTVFTVAYSL